MIEATHLTKYYGSTAAIDDVSFHVEPGEILGFLGPNGAGKTTTMRILTGYLPANQGTARIANYDIHTDSMAVRQRIGYLPETPPLYPDMTVEGFLHFVTRIKGVAAGDRAAQVDGAMARCNLTDRRTMQIRKLSKGYRQRVGIAQAIVHDPPAIILDEPTVGLDPRQIIEVRNLIKSLAGEHTIILSTHILPEVSMTCHRVAIINQGRLVVTDTPDRLMARLAGGLGYELEVAGDREQILRVLHELLAVETVTAIAADDLPEHHVRLQVTTPTQADVGAQLATAIVQAGFGLYELRRTRISLEDVFLNLTMQDRVEESAIAHSPEAEAIATDSTDAADRVDDASRLEPSPSPVPEEGEADAHRAE